MFLNNSKCVPFIWLQFTAVGETTARVDQVARVETVDQVARVDPVAKVVKADPVAKVVKADPVVKVDLAAKVEVDPAANDANCHLS